MRGPALGAVGLAALAIGVVAVGGRDPGQILGAASLGGPVSEAGIVVGGAGRALVLDDGVPDRLVTVQSGPGGVRSYGWSYSSGAGPDNALHVVDARRGALVGALDAGTATGLAADPYTGRAFTFDAPQQQMQVLDSVRGTPLRTVPLALASQTDLGLLSRTAVADPRSGHLFVLLDAPDTGAAYATPEHALVMLNGRSGALVRQIPLPPHASITGGPPSAPITYAAPALCLLDARAGRLYLFGFGRVGELRVFDTASGRPLAVRRLHTLVSSAALDARSGHLFVVAAPPSLVGRPQRRPRGTIDMVDARTGAVLRTVAGGAAVLMTRTLVVDAGSHLAFALDPLQNAVAVLAGVSGRRVRTLTLRHPSLEWAFDAARHRAYALSDAGLNVVDTARGRVLRTAPLALSPDQGVVGVAVDPVSGHVLVELQSLHGPRRDPWSWLPPWLRARLALGPPPAALAPNQRVLSHTLLTLDPTR